MSIFKTCIKKEVIYNEEQIKFITSPLENCKLIGIPGGGKTESIIGKIIYHNLINDFLVLTFSKRACNDFIDKSTKYNNTIFHKNNISTFHSLAGKIIYEILEKQSNFQALDLKQYLQLPKLFLLDIHHRLQGKKLFCLSL